MALLVVLAWGLLVEPRLLDVDQERVAIPSLHASWDGQEVAFISDLQVGMELANTGTIRRAIDGLVDEPPAVVLIGGDFVYGSQPPVSEQAELVASLVAPLTEAGIPTFAVLGNHDYEAGQPEEVIAALGDVGVRVLRNEAASIESADGHRLHVVGIGSYVAGRSRPRAAFREVPAGAPRLVFMHNPNSFPELGPDVAPVAIAGHTHGGQIRLPFLPEWSYLALLSDDRVATDGWIDGYGSFGNRLFVSRGIGMSNVAMRINCPPQIVRFELAAA